MDAHGGPISCSAVCHTFRIWAVGGADGEIRVVVLVSPRPRTLVLGGAFPRDSPPTEMAIVVLPHRDGLLLARDRSGNTRVWGIRWGPGGVQVTLRPGRTVGAGARSAGLWGAVAESDPAEIGRHLDLGDHCWQCGLLLDLSPCWHMCLRSAL